MKILFTCFALLCFSANLSATSHKPKKSKKRILFEEAEIGRNFEIHFINGWAKIYNIGKEKLYIKVAEKKDAVGEYWGGPFETSWIPRKKTRTRSGYYTLAPRPKASLSFPKMIFQRTYTKAPLLDFDSKKIQMQSFEKMKITFKPNERGIIEVTQKIDGKTPLDFEPFYFNFPHLGFFEMQESPYLNMEDLYWKVMGRSFPHGLSSFEILKKVKREPL